MRTCLIASLRHTAFITAVSLATLCAALSFPTQAEQLSFQKRIDNDAQQAHFSYRWRDQYSRERQIDFNLPLAAEHAIGTSRHISPARIQRDIVRPLTAYAREQGWHQMDIRYNQAQQRIEIQPNIRNESQSQRRLQQMRLQEQREIDRVLAENHFTFLNIHPGLRGIAPDHPRIAAASRDVVEPISRAFFNSLGGASPRQYIETIASFIQAIPYQELTNRMESHGQGYSPPARVIFDNRGDCDSKVTLMAAILRNLMPNLHIAIIYMPGHAMLGLAIEPEEDEQWIMHDGRKYLIVEPTGPAQLRLGEAGRDSYLHLANQTVTVRSM
ncbi:MAG: hypothetical protein JJU10_02325 [Idiomarina sp.]|nr:hypothetical protein [Idiomarina sp.]